VAEVVETMGPALTGGWRFAAALLRALVVAAVCDSSIAIAA
jgi:hypothetical protein